MFAALRKFWAFVSPLLIFILLASLFFWPALARPLGLAILIVSLGVTVFFTIQNHWQHRQAGDSKQFVRSLALDLLGLGVTMVAAMYTGGALAAFSARLAGAYLGLRAGLWASLLAGLAAGFLAAWGVRFAWKRLAARV